MEQNDDLKKKEKRTLAIVSTVLVLTLVLGISFAYFIAQGQSSEQIITTANLGLTFDDGTPIINEKDIIPVTIQNVPTKATNKTFTLTKKEGSKDIYAKIELSDISVTNALAKYDLKWALYKGTTAEVSAGTATKIATGDFGGKTSGDIIIATNQLISSTPVEYNLYIWINETNLNQSTMMGQTLTATIKATGSSVQENTLTNAILNNGTQYITGAEYEYIGCDASCVESLGEEECYNLNQCTGRNPISSEYSQLDKTIYSTPTFSTTSTDKGLFVQQGDTTKSEMGFPTYYYRGQNDNNYVQFGNYTSSGEYLYHISSVSTTRTFKYNANDPILWRIVRINEDGSIRLMSNEVITDIFSNDLMLYHYSNGLKKPKVDDWYASNIGNVSSLDNKVITSSFCADTSDNYNGAKTRLTNNNPIFTCPSGATTLYEKVGLITADEAMYVGALLNKTNQDNTTYLDNALHYTLTPYDDSANIMYGIDSGLANSDDASYISTTTSLRAVINLSPDVTITGGNGTSGSPYIIK